MEGIRVTRKGIIEKIWDKEARARELKEELWRKKELVKKVKLW